MRTDNVTFTPEEYQIVVRAVPKGAILLLGEYNNTPSATVEDFVASIQLEGIDILNYKCNNMYIRKLCQYVTIPSAKMYWNAALGTGTKFRCYLVNIVYLRRCKKYHTNSFI